MDLYFILKLLFIQAQTPLWLIIILREKMSAGADDK